MEIFVNGEPRNVDDGAALDVVLIALGFEPKRIAVAVNETFVPRTEHAGRALAPGDRIDVVTRIEGG